MRTMRSEVGRESSPRVATYVGQLAFVAPSRSVHEDGYVEFIARPMGEIVTSGASIVYRAIGQWNERHDVHHTETRMHPSVITDVESVDASHCEISNGGLAHECENTAMVMTVGMSVEQISPADLVEDGQTFGIASFAHVDHALEHDPTLPVVVVA